MKKFIKTINGSEYNWEVVTLPLDKVEDPALINIDVEMSTINKIPNRKLSIYIKLYKSGTVFPPIVIDEENKVMDGTHRLLVYKYLKLKEAKFLRRCGKGAGNVRGKFPGKSTYPYKGMEMYCVYHCLICERILTYQPKHGVASPIWTFPQGLPSGELWFCEDCGIIVKEDFVVWELPSSHPASGKKGSTSLKKPSKGKRTRTTNG